MSGPPPLARALAARFRTVTNTDGPGIEAAMVPAVAALDAADRAYRAAIGELLPAPAARTVLETMAAYRSEVMSIRERVRTELEALYARAGRSYGDFDALDAFVPSPAGLSHLDGVRAADLADRAKAQAAALRAEANARIAQAVAGNVAAIVEAKRRRNAAFAGAIHAVVVPLSGGAVSGVIEPLAALAEGWY